MGNRITEKHKFFFLVAMILVAGCVAYFRFVQPRDASGTPSPTTAPDQRPVVSISKSAEPVIAHRRSVAAPPDIPRSIGRNIFEPTGPLPAAPIESTQPKPKHHVEMALTGTIIGGERSMAIINSKFVRQGQMVGSYKVTRITPDKVFLDSSDDQLCLEVISAPEAISE